MEAAASAADLQTDIILSGLFLLIIFAIMSSIVFASGVAATTTGNDPASKIVAAALSGEDATTP